MPTAVGRRLVGAKKAHLRAARAGAVAANQGGKDTKMNTTTMIRDLFMSDYDGPGAQLTGCIVDAGAAHSTA